MHVDPPNDSDPPCGSNLERTADAHDATLDVEECGEPDLLPAPRMPKVLSDAELRTALSFFHFSDEAYRLIMGYSEEWRASRHSKEPLPVEIRQRIVEIIRIRDAIKKIINGPTKFIGGWLQTPSEYLGGLSALELVRRGELSRLWTEHPLLQQVKTVNSGAENQRS